MNLLEVKFGSIFVDPETNTRRDYGSDEEKEALKASIAENGLLQPLIVARNADGFDLVAGFRRYAAIVALRESGNGKKFDEIPVNEVTTKHPRKVLTLTENVMRKNLNALEIAQALADLKETGLSQTDIAEVLGVKAGFVSRYISLLKTAPEVQAAVQVGEISVVAANQIAKVEIEHQPKALLKARQVAGKLGVSVSEAAKETVSRAKPVRERKKKNPDRVKFAHTPIETAETLDGLIETAKLTGGSKSTDETKGIVKALSWILGRRKSL